MITYQACTKRRSRKTGRRLKISGRPRTMKLTKIKKEVEKEMLMIMV